MKKIGLIVCVILLFFVVILLGINNAGKHTKSVEVESAKVDSTSPALEVQSEPTYDLGLIEIEDDSILDYSAPILESNGYISGKSLFLDGFQIVYYLEISLDGISSDKVDYFCSYDVYSSILLQDRVLVRYQKLSESTFSVNSVVLK